MPVIRFGDRIPSPVGGFEILEDDARVLIFFRRIAPDIEIAPARSRSGPARALEPGMLVGSMIQHHFRQNPDAAVVGLLQEILEIPQRSVGGMDVVVVGDVVAIVAPGRGKERQQPDRCDAQILKVIELLGKAAKVAHPVLVAVEEGTNVDFIDDRRPCTTAGPSRGWL